MFEIDRQRTSLPLPAERVLALVTSLNEPLVVADDMPVEPTRAYVCAYAESGDRCAFSIYLHCMQSNKGVFYRHEDRTLPRERFEEAMAEAMAFAESLGFMMDDLRWRELDTARKRELLEETPLFHEPRPHAASEPGPLAEDGPPPPPAPPVAAPDPPTPPPAAPPPAAPAPAAARTSAPASAAPPAPVLTVGATDVELEIEPPAPGPARPGAPPRAAPPVEGAAAVEASRATPGRAGAAPVTVDMLPSRLTAPPPGRAGAPAGGALAATAQLIVRLLASL